MCRLLSIISPSKDEQDVYVWCWTQKKKKRESVIVLLFFFRFYYSTHVYKRIIFVCSLILSAYHIVVLCTSRCVPTYGCITLAASSSPSQFFRCSIEMSESAKNATQHIYIERERQQKLAIRREKKERSDVEHIYQRSSNSDRSCQTERRKRLGSIVVYYGV